MTTLAAPSRLLRIGESEAHVWYALTDRQRAPQELQWYRSLLSSEEAQRAARFVFEHLELEHLLTRALCRLTLSRYARVHPRDWKFRTNCFGRPQIDWSSPVTRIDFNLSNTKGMVVCILTAGGAAGIDVENLERPGETLAIADRFFSPAEVEAVRALPASRQPQRFFQLWTLKEAYIKARGMGLSLPLERFSFELSEPIRISFAAGFQDTASEWQFASRFLGPRHVLSLAIRKGTGPDFSIRVAEALSDPPKAELLHS